MIVRVFFFEKRRSFKLDFLLQQVGHKVKVKTYEGVIRFIGTTEFASGEWIGVELKEAKGKNDGSIKGV